MFKCPVDMRNLKQRRQELANERGVLVCANRFVLVGDPTRMKISWLLCHHRELSVGEIVEVLDVSVSVVSHSLRKLREYHLVRARRKQLPHSGRSSG